MPSAAVFDSRTLQSPPESGSRAGYDGHKRKKGSKLHMVVDTLGFLLTMHATPANEQDRARVAKLAEAVQEVTSKHVEVACVDQGYTGEDAAQAAQEHGITLQVAARSGWRAVRGTGVRDQDPQRDRATDRHARGGVGGRGAGPATGGRVRPRRSGKLGWPDADVPTEPAGS